MTKHDYDCLLVIAGIFEDAVTDGFGLDGSAGMAQLLVSKDDVELIRNVVLNSKRYDFLCSHPSAKIDCFSHQYRVALGNEVITDWCDSQDKAIDEAIEYLK